MLAKALQGAGKSAVPAYIEDVFSTYLYTGTSANRSIVNDIDLAGKGGLVWIKTRSEPWEHYLADTVRGTSKSLATNNTSPESTGLTNAITSFNSNGFSLGIDTNLEAVNRSPKNYVSWTFRDQPKFFDVVTYTGNGANRTISHNLGSVPGFIIVKRTDATVNWQCYHRSLANTQYMVINTTDAVATGATRWNSTTPTSTVFSVGTATETNASGGTYVAYLFAHDAGGFGASGTDNVISCGSYVGNGGVNPINLGYEAQWVFVKRIDSDGGDWWCSDITRGMTVGSIDPAIAFNSSNPENTSHNWVEPRANGFALTSASVVTTNSVNGSGFNYIYIAIRRGPMKTPTDATKVFSPLTRTGTGAVASVTGVGFTPDLLWSKSRNTGNAIGLHDRLRGSTRELLSNSTAIEFNDASSVTSINMDGYSFGTDASASGTVNLNTANYIYWNFKRAPGFFDEVCYTETGSARAQPHNLGVVPELIIQKSRSSVVNWIVSFNFTATTQNLAKLNLTTAANINITYASAGEMTAAPTATNVNLAAAYATNTTLVMYLFATLAGVSKVGSYTGTAALQTVNCGFAAGARFVLIKRTDSTGDWYVWDSARGISSGNDPYLLLNSTAAEVTGTNYVDTDTTGFKVTAAAPAALNASGGTYIFLAIA